MNRVLLVEMPPEYERGWRLIEEDLVCAKAHATLRGIRLIVFPVPTAQEFLQAYPDEQYRARLADVAARHGLEYFDPTPSMQSAGEGFERYFITWDGHVSPEAHAVIAQFLAREIAAHGALAIGGTPGDPGP